MESTDKTVSYRRRGGEGTLTLSGPVSISEAAALRDAALRTLGDDKATTVHLSLTRVERLDVAAMQILCVLRREVEAQGRAFTTGTAPGGVEAFQAGIGCTL